MSLRDTARGHRLDTISARHDARAIAVATVTW